MSKRGYIEWMLPGRALLLLGLLVLPLLVCALPQSRSGRAANASVVDVSGCIRDSLSRSPMTYVNVTLTSGKDAVITDKKGRFRLKSVEMGDTLVISSLGYEKRVIPVAKYMLDSRDYILMQNSETELGEVIVINKRPKYSKKNNPAVDLMQRIRKSYPQHNPLEQPYYSYDKYEKTVLSLNDFHKENAGWLSKRLDPIDDFIDTAHITGRPVLNISVREKNSTRLHSRSPSRDKTLVRGFRSVGIDDQLNQENIQIMLDDVLREVDIFGNDITLMQNRFVSPLAAIGADYYKYFMGDTVTVEGKRIAELIFVPHNPESFSFNGSLYVDIDSPDAFVTMVTMRIPKALNINFVRNIFVEQHFERDSLGNRMKTAEDMSVELQLISGVQGFYANKHTDFSGYTYEHTPDFDTYGREAGATVYMDGYDRRPAEYWLSARPVAISGKEQSVDNLSDRLNSNRFLYWLRKGINVLVTGYVPTGNPSKFDIGPVNTMISANSIEGARFRLGGMTKAALSPHLFARAYGAYGTKDNKWKYHGELEYSFRRCKQHSREFPMHSIRLEHTYDLNMIGQHYLFTNADNVFLSLKRKDNNLGTYRALSQLSYIYEHASGLTISAGAKMSREWATPWLPFTDGGGISHRHFNQSSFFLDIQYAPGATFIQTASMRLPVNMDTWIFRLSHEYGPKGMLGADFTTNKTEFSVQKRFWFSAFGYCDVIAKGGKIWSKVQYPALTWPNANLSYTVQPESYSLMNPMEFAMDTYAAWDVTYWMNGMIFNRIPLLKELKLREVVNFKGLWGHLSHRNDPAADPSLFRFPEDSKARTMSGTPYMEISAGLDNIFSILRVDYVWRLSYRGTPGAPDSGVRIALHFSF